mmetsp:Transcript_1641/g.4987  ORF Transcript_1641/g.4987 Transcript_1641/m.4987 type:complete len:107 (+) Transcript_1641:720-1040(+)
MSLQVRLKIFHFHDSSTGIIADLFKTVGHFHVLVPSKSLAQYLIKRARGQLDAQRDHDCTCEPSTSVSHPKPSDLLSSHESFDYSSSCAEQLSIPISFWFLIKATS